MASGEPLSVISGPTLEKAKKELFEVPEKRGELITQLREKIDSWTPSVEDEDEQSLTFARKDDKFLLRFLRSRKFDLDRSLQLYVNYYKYRHKHSHILGQLSANSAEEVLRSGLVSVLPPTAGPRVIVIRASLLDLEVMSPNVVLKSMLLILDQVLDDEETQVHGVVVVEDLAGFSLLDSLKLSSNEAFRKGITIELIQESFPARFKGIHFMNQPWYFSLIFAIVRPFMKQKLRERFQSHGGDFESLYGSIHPDNLPQEYGGALLSVENYSAVHLFADQLANNDQ